MPGRYDFWGYDGVCALGWRACLSAGMATAAALVGGCGATMGDLTTASTGGIAGYQEASMFSPTGYSLSNGPNGAIHVTAAGPPGTPPERLEKIALARAAEYGHEQHLKSFTASPSQTSFKCGKTKYYVKGERTDVHPSDYRVVELDVTYGTDAMAPQARSTRDTAEALKAELASETVAPDIQSAAAQEVAQQCHR
jgi:hypothetical protein